MTLPRKLPAAGALLTLSAAVAAADIPPLPGESERALAAVIVAAGHKCDGAVRYRDAGEDAAKPYRAHGLSAVYRVDCATGGSYLVALPNAVLRARPPRLDSNGNPIPFPPPAVKPIEP